MQVALRFSSAKGEEVFLEDRRLHLNDLALLGTPEEQVRSQRVERQVASYSSAPEDQGIALPPIGTLHLCPVNRMAPARGRGAPVGRRRR